MPTEVDQHPASAHAYCSTKSRPRQGTSCRSEFQSLATSHCKCLEATYHVPTLVVNFFLSQFDFFLPQKRTTAAFHLTRSSNLTSPSDLLMQKASLPLSETQMTVGVQCRLLFPWGRSVTPAARLLSWLLVANHRIL